MLWLAPLPHLKWLRFFTRRPKGHSSLLAELLQQHRCAGPFSLLSCSLATLLTIRLQIYVIDSADRKRVEETGVELNLLMEEEKLAG
jgi:hypothetical protein